MPGFNAVPHAPSSGGGIKNSGPPVYCAAESAIKHTYHYQTGQWTRVPCTVQLSTKPFNQGTLRIIYHMMDMSLPEDQQHVVAKVAKDPNEPSEAYFTDVRMQGKAKSFADSFNRRNPPKQIGFVLPYIVEFQNRRSPRGTTLVMGVEPFMQGEYKKHTNNFGFVHRDDRNTPQAFSHFTYVHSKQRQLVCDIQGVADLYTDPQIHSADGSQRWGKADLGQQGIQKFFSTHRCNAICEFLSLPVHSGRKKRAGLPEQVKPGSGGSGGAGAGQLGMTPNQAVGGGGMDQNFSGMLMLNAGLSSGAGMGGIASGGLGGLGGLGSGGMSGMNAFGSSGLAGASNGLSGLSGMNGLGAGGLSGLSGLSSGLSSAGMSGLSGVGGVNALGSGLSSGQLLTPAALATGAPLSSAPSGMSRGLSARPPTSAEQMLRSKSAPAVAGNLALS